MALYIPNASPIPMEEAQRLVLATVHSLPTTYVPLSQAYGYCLAVDVRSDHHVPMFDRSTVDGYALQAEDVKSADRSNPVRLSCIEEIPAGYIPEQRITPGKASRIMTGAPIPKGADAVVKVEETKRGEEEGRSSVWVYRAVTAGEAILRKGADVEEGKIILPAGSYIGPVEVGLLSTFGVAAVPVYAKPKVGILSTGTELLHADQQISLGKHRDSNGVMLAGQVREAGGDPVYMGIVQDNPEELEKRMIEALQQVDVLVTSGGVSMGDYDFLGNTFENIGAKVVFWKTLIRPGLPALFGTWQNKPIFALAGNPASSYVNAWLYLLPAIRRMCGWNNPLPGRLTGICDEPIAMLPTPHTRFLRGFTYVSASGELRVRLSPKQASGVLSSFLESNCLVRVPGEKEYAAGERVEVEMLGKIGESVWPQSWL